MKPNMPRRGRDSTGSIASATHFAQCDVNPLTSRGRTIQLFGLVMLPLLPNIALLVYTCTRLYGHCLIYQHSLLISNYVDLSVRAVAVTVHIGEGVSDQYIDSVTNWTLIFGTSNNEFEKALTTGKLLKQWPDEKITSHADLMTRVLEYQGSFSETTIQDMSFYIDLESIMIPWAINGLLENTGKDTWFIVNSFCHLLEVYKPLIMSKTYATLYHLVGHLDEEQYALLFEYSETLLAHLNSTFLYTDETLQLYTAQLNIHTSLQTFKKHLEDIVDNKRISPILYNTVLLHTKYNIYQSIIDLITENITGHITQMVHDDLITSSLYITYHVIVLMFIISFSSPFIVLSSQRTTRSLLVYSITMEKKTVELKREKRKIDTILNQMLPRAVAYRLKRGDMVTAEEFEIATVFFSDIADFNEISTISSPMQIVGLLNEIYNFMDTQLERYDIYKVETIGATYMVVSGVPMRNGKRHATEIARMALDTIYATENFVLNYLRGRQLKLRIGAHSGPLVAGVVGNKTPRYCLFGDTVNTASRMQSSGKARKIHISEAMKNALDDVGGFHMKKRGPVEIKGKGMMTTYWLISREGALYDANISASEVEEESECAA